ncbi:MAG: hypothetical protein L3K02_08940, partial [Thermoplasmata archaeon]|nr:hypothetical protein [Thermoplasmata archaeon]
HDQFHLLTDKIAPPENVVEHYNRIQILLAIIAALLTAIVQYLAYKTGKMELGSLLTCLEFRSSARIGSRSLRRL